MEFKVERLTIQGLRGIDELKLEFSQSEPTVFIGVNGVGKTTILYSLSCLLIQFIEDICIEFLDKDFPWLGSNHIVQDMRKNFAQINSSVEFRFTRSKHQVKTVLKVTWQKHKESFKGRDGLELEYDVDEEIDDEVQTLVTQLKDKTDISIPLFIHYPTNRVVLEESLADNYDEKVKNTLLDLELKAPQLLAYIHELQEDRVIFKYFFEWFVKRQNQENDIRLTEDLSYRDKYLQSVRNAVYALIPGFSNLRIRHSPYLRMVVEKDGEELTIDQLSDGEKCLLAMVGDIARRLAIANPGLEDPLQGSGVILIDEIELHLHPYWQRRVIPALTRTFPNCQFIVTTHSPQVISHVKPEGIYVLEKTETGIMAYHPEASFGRDSNRILEELMYVTERPQEIQVKFLELFHLIDAGDLESARALRNDLEEAIGASEPQFAKADILIRRKEILDR